MKKAAITGITALTLLDISASTPASAQGIDTFVGPYIGAHAGYSTGNADFTSTPNSVTSNGQNFSIPGRNDSLDSDGFIGGVHGGINFLLGTAFILRVSAKAAFHDAAASSESVARSSP